MKQKFILIASIMVLDDGRRRRDSARVQRYAEAMRAGVVQLPILVLDGSAMPHADAQVGKMYLLDGFHRLQAAQQLGFAEVDAVLLTWSEYQPIALRGFIHLPPGRVPLPLARDAGPKSCTALRRAEE